MLVGGRGSKFILLFNRTISFVLFLSMYRHDSFDIVACRMLYYYSVLGHVQLDWGNAVPRVAFVAIVATVVESLPISEVVDDNLSVPLITMAVACFAFPH